MVDRAEDAVPPLRCNPPRPAAPDVLNPKPKGAARFAGSDQESTAVARPGCAAILEIGSCDALRLPWSRWEQQNLGGIAGQDGRNPLIVRRYATRHAVTKQNSGRAVKLG